MTKREVLDHGFVRLVSYMQPVPESIPLRESEDPRQYSWTGDLEIARNARVSFDADWRVGTDEGSDDRLVRRLHARGHTSPFEAMVFTFEVQAPIFVFRQWHRHRTWSYNELSARYGVLPELFYIPELDQIRPQSKSDKQGRQMDETIPAAATAQFSLKNHCKEGFRRYHEMLDMGIARETARMVLPLNTYSRMFATVDLHNLFHFLRLRLDSHAQYEIRVYAEAILELIEPVCPIAVDAFEHERGKSQLTKEDWEAIRLALDSEIEMIDGVGEEEDIAYGKRLQAILDKLDGG